MRDENETTGERIRRWRITRGLTQEQLAQAVDVSQQQIRNYENGATDIPLSRIEKIARILRITIHDLVCGGTVAAKSRTEASREAPDDRGILIAWHAAIDEKVKAAVLVILRRNAKRRRRPCPKPGRHDELRG